MDVRLPRLEKTRRGFVVGIQPVLRPNGRDYNGPSAEVYIENGWLHINTDDVEGDAMLNVEALPALLEALVQLHTGAPGKKSDTPAVRLSSSE